MLTIPTFDPSNFTSIPFLIRLEKPWGYELIFTPPQLPYTGKIIHIQKGKRLSLQVHDKKQESYFLTSGECHLIVESKRAELVTVPMEQLKGYTILVGQKHRLAAVTDCDIFEVSTPEIGITYRIEDDYKRTNETEEMRKEERNLNNPHV